MYTEQELSVLEILEGHNLPTIVLSSPRIQLPILAKCYISNVDINTIHHLCTRVRILLEPQHYNDFSADEIANTLVSRELILCISNSIVGWTTVSTYLGDMYGRSMHCRLMKDQYTKCTIRNIWIKQTLAHYLTTVEEQLLRGCQNGQL